jgi:hypothetical protein
MVGLIFVRGRRKQWLYQPGSQDLERLVCSYVFTVGVHFNSLTSDRPASWVIQFGGVISCRKHANEFHIGALGSALYILGPKRNRIAFIPFREARRH